MLLVEKGFEIILKQLACVASVSVVFQREEESKKDGLDVLAMGKVG